MSDRPSADRTAELLLWFHQEPLRYQREARRRDAPPLDPEVILKLALGRRVELADPALWGVHTEAALKEAAAAYVRQVFFRADATPYQTLGLAQGASDQAIKESFRLLMQLVHPDRQDGEAQWPESFAAQANRAYAILRNQDSRSRFDREAQARAAAARAAHRAAAAEAASLMPVVLRANGGIGGRPTLTRSMLPEWLTAGVGGYAREHPATIAFAALTCGAVVILVAALRDGRDETLTRESRDPVASAAPAAPAPTQVSARLAARAPAAVEPGIRDSVGAQSAVAPNPIAAYAGASVVAKPGVADVDKARAAVVADAGAAALPSARPIPAASAGVTPIADTGASIPANAGTASAVGPASAGRSSPTADPMPRDRTASAVGPASAGRSNPTGDPMPPARTIAEPRVVAVVDAPSARPPAPTVATPGTDAPVASPPPAVAVPAAPATAVALATPAAAPAGRAEPIAPAAEVPAPPATAEIEALFSAFVEAYERGRLDAFAALFDADADTNLRHGRAAIRGEYDELFRLSNWRRMQLTRINWRRIGERAYAKGEIAVTISWRDGREVEQRLAVDMELVRRDGRVVIAKLSHQPRGP